MVNFAWQQEHLSIPLLEMADSKMQNQNAFKNVVL